MKQTKGQVKVTDSK